MNVLAAGLACFFSGRGKTRPVMLINAIGMAVNIPLDYALINGIWLFPELGIRGAGIATVCSWTLMAMMYAGLIFNRENDRRYGILSHHAFDAQLSMRIIRKGAPAALQFASDVFAFTFFIFMVGRLGRIELAVSNIAFSLESLAFMPAVGFSIGLSTLVGQSLGRNDVDAALRFTKQTICILMGYILLLDLLFFSAPRWILAIFIMGEHGSAAYPQLLARGVAVLRIMAFFISFDAMYFTFIGVLKGAGDTRFIMWSIGGVTLGAMVLPLTLVVEVLGWGLIACWVTLTIYVLSLFCVSFLRYRQGKWKSIRVI